MQMASGSVKHCSMLEHDIRRTGVWGSGWLFVRKALAWALTFLITSSNSRKSSLVYSSMGAPWPTAIRAQSRRPRRPRSSGSSLIMRGGFLLAHLLVAAAERLTFGRDGSFKILHLSDIHYEVGPSTLCRNVPVSLAAFPCSGLNSTAFIRRVLALERPDLVVFTGDVVDWATHPSRAGMDDVYGLMANVPWAATLGNHDDQSDLNRSQVMQYVVGLPHTLSEVNAVGSGDTEAFGNFALDIYSDNVASRPSFRTFHLDSTTHDASITPAQVRWFERSAATRPVEGGEAPPALLFTHVPLEEFHTAVASGRNVSGSWNEKVSFQPVNSGIFRRLAGAGVVAVYSGHDHTNDFCALHEGVQLCYEGSPGYQAYGADGFARRVRVTEVRGHGASVRSWKRLDDDALTRIDLETLWAHPASGAAWGEAATDAAHRRWHGVADPQALPDPDQWDSSAPAFAAQ